MLKFRLPLLSIALCCFALLPAQTIQDCLGAIPVCQSVYSEEQSPVGEGDIPNEVSTVGTCTAGEINSIWYVFTAAEDGQLGFLITPNDLDDDYDWVLYDITNGDCDDLIQQNVVSCNAAGGSGCHGQTGCTASGIGDWTEGGCGGTGPLNELVAMQQGNTYVLMVSNWSGSPNGYTLDFSESTGIGVFDETNPLVESVDLLPQSCGDDEIHITFNEFLKCNSINDDAFQLTGPGGPYSIDASSVDCFSNDSRSKDFVLTISPSIQSMGEFTLTVQGQSENDLLDVCDNPAEDFIFQFTVDVPLMAPINIGQDTSLLCDGDEIILDVSNEGTIFLWEDGSTDPTFVVNTGGVYAVTVTDECRMGADSIEVFVQQFPPTVELGEDQLLCPGNNPTLDADNGLAFYTWQDGSSQPFYNVNATGDYAVTVTNGCGTVEDDVNVTFVPPLGLNLPTEFVLCLGDTLTVDVERPFATYSWGDGNSNPFRQFTVDGTHQLRVETICEVYDITFEIIFLVDPQIELGNDLVLCPNDSLVLNPNIPGADYLWQDGSTSPTLTITTPNTYRVTVSTACNDLIDSIVIDYLLPITTDLGRDTFLCEDAPYLLDATSQGLVDYQWENGTKAPERLIFGPDTYSVTATTPCETVIDTLVIEPCVQCRSYFPNVFSPNVDGVNDRFFAQSNCFYDTFELLIFDRWGNLIFQTTDPNPQSGWDGKIKGQPAPEGTYVWMATFTVTENGNVRQDMARGDVALVR